MYNNFFKADGDLNRAIQFLGPCYEDFFLIAMCLHQATLDEEGNADKKLTKIAYGGLFKPGINLQANIPNANKPIDLNKKISRPKKTKSITPKRKPSLDKK